MPNAARRNMHGFVSLVVAVSFAYIILLLAAYYMEMRGVVLRTDEELMLIKNHNARELETKRMVSNTIDHSIQNIPPDMDSENASRYVASQLALLEGKEDSSYNTNHLRINFWCGFISSDEAISMKAEMLERRQIVICPRPGCRDMDEYILYPSQRCLEEAYAEGNPSECLVPACAPFLKIHCKREKIGTWTRCLAGGGGYQYHRITHPHSDGATCLLCQLARFNEDFLAA